MCDRVPGGIGVTAYYREVFDNEPIIGAELIVSQKGTRGNISVRFGSWLLASEIGDRLQPLVKSE